MARMRRGRRTWLWAPVALGLAAISVQAAEAPIPPGVYDELLLGYAPATHTLTGYFHSETGGGQFSCIFYLTGKVSGNVTRIRGFFPETPKEQIGGTLSAASDGHVAISLDEEPGGCAMMQPFADKARPAGFGLTGAHPWIQVRVVRGKKSYFYNAPGAATHRKGYLVQGDGVGVKTSAGGWLQVEYPNPDEMGVGWMRETDFYPGP